MPYEFYKVLHIASVLLVFIALTARLYSGRKAFGILHGIGLLTLLVSGFGLAARLGLMQGLPKWVWIKLGIWFLLGAAATLIKRSKIPAYLQVTLWVILGVIAVSSAVYKPY